MFENIKKDFNRITWALIPAAMFINGAFGWVVARFDLPLYMDTIGTVFVAVIAGPWAGALTGVLTNIVLGIVSPGFIPYWPVPLFIGLVTGFCANAGWFKNLRKVALTGIFIALTAATLSTLIAINLYGKFVFNGSYFLVKEPVDKIITVLLVYIIVKRIPERYFSYFPRPENVKNADRI